MNSLFPLRLSPFEEYMLRDDRPAYPMHIWCRLKLSGIVDRTALGAALQAALAMHPLLVACLEDALGKPHWRQPAHELTDLLSWSQSDEPRETFDPIDLANQPALRVHASARNDQVELLLHFHHCNCDGGGLLAFLADWFQHYHALVSDDAAAKPRPRDLERLKGRSNFWLSNRRLLAMLPHLLCGIPNVLRFKFLRAEALTTDSPSMGANGERYFPGWLTHHCSPAQTVALRQRSKRLGGSLNDLLIRDLLLTLSRWPGPGVNQRRDWLRVSVPMNLRTEREANLTATNVVSMTFISRRGKLLQQPAELLTSVSRQMNYNKRHRLGLLFPLLLGVARKAGRLASLTSADQCRATTVLTNLGEIFRETPLPRSPLGELSAGGLTLNAMEVIPPVRPFTPATFSVLTYAGRLTLGMHYDRRVFSPELARSLLDLYVATMFEPNS